VVDGGAGERYRRAMLARSTAIAIVLALVAPGCGGKEDPTVAACRAYAQRDFECGGYPASEKDLTLKLAEGFCREIAAGNRDLAELKGIAAGPTCVKTTKTCDEYKACIARAEAAP
jgi:hypothetical protein